MKHKNIFLSIILIFSLFLTGCGLPPPKGTPYKSFVSFISEFLKESNASQDNKEMKYEIRKKMENIDFVIAGKKGDKIEFINTPTTPASDKELIYYQGNSIFVFTRGVYITSYKTKFLFSFDNEKWYPVFAQDVNERGDHENLINKIIFKPSLISSSYLKAPFEFRMYINDTLIEYSNLNKNEIRKREVVQFGQNTVIESRDKSKIETDLEKVIMYLPKGTKVNFSLESEGNLLFAENYQDTMTLTLKTDMYFYRPEKYKASFSFDNKNWGLNIVSFKVAFSQESYVKNNTLMYNYIITAQYKG